MLSPILRQAMLRPTHTAVIDDQRQWRYIDLIGGAWHLAQRIEAVSSARHVGILLPTSGAFPMALLATWMLGCVAVPINYLLSPGERQYIIDDSGIDTLVTARAMLDALGSEPDNVRLIEVDRLDYPGLPPMRWPAKAAAHDVAVILYTSGTSGRPKGVMLTHGNLFTNVRDSTRHMHLTSADGFLGVLPQFHSFGLTGLTLLPLAVGTRVVYTARFQPRKLVQMIREYRPEFFVAIPSMYNAMLSVKEADAGDFRTVRMAISGSEPLPRDVFDRFNEQFGVPIREGYGLTETSPVVSVNTPGRHRVGSVGRLIPNCTAKIVDDSGRALPVEAEGEITLAGPNIMAGYFKQPDLTAEVIDAAGYFRTGDWGKLDGDGYLYITGRKKEMLIISGENVFPREVEEVLNRHPAIKASAVIGRRDPARGESPAAFLELNEGASIDENELRAFCRRHLANFKVPKEFHVVDALPRNATGKIMRRELKLPDLAEATHA